MIKIEWMTKEDIKNTLQQGGTGGGSYAYLVDTILINKNRNIFFQTLVLIHELFHAFFHHIFGKINHLSFYYDFIFDNLSLFLDRLTGIKYLERREKQNAKL